MPIAAGTPAVQSRTQEDYQEPQVDLEAQCKRDAEQEDASIGNSSSESTWNPKASDPYSSQVGKATPHSSDLEDEEQQEVPLVDNGMSLEELGVRAKSSRSGQFEDVGSPSKIPRGERTIPKQFPGARRVAKHDCNDEEEAEYFDDEVMDAKHDCNDEEEAEYFDDEVMDDPLGDEEDLMYSDSDGEQNFKDEDAGPLDLNEDDVLKKDKKAIMVEMERLEKLDGIQLVPLSELKEQKDKGIDCAKMVFGWRFRQENGLDVADLGYSKE